MLHFSILVYLDGLQNSIYQLDIEIDFCNLLRISIPQSYYILQKQCLSRILIVFFHYFIVFASELSNARRDSRMLSIVYAAFPTNNKPATVSRSTSPSYFVNFKYITVYAPLSMHIQANSVFYTCSDYNNFHLS